MYKYEFLNLKNLKNLKELIAKDITHSHLEKKFIDEYEELSFIYKLFYRKNIVLLKMNKEYIGYMWVVRYEEDKYKINRIMLNVENNIDSVSLYRGFFYKFPKNRYFEIDEIDLEEGLKEEKMLIKLGFTEVESVCNMKKSELKYGDFELSEELSFKSFVKGVDEELRCNIQNDIFRNKNRIDLDIQDIILEESQDYYLEDTSFFLMFNNEAIGYGQLILEEKGLFIVNLGIIEKFRGNGYSKLIIQKMINVALDMGHSEVYLKCSGNNYPALKVYKDSGFEVMKNDKKFSFQNKKR